MTLEELEIQLKEMRDEGATGDEEIVIYTDSEEFIITDINLYIFQKLENII